MEFLKKSGAEAVAAETAESNMNSLLQDYYKNANTRNEIIKHLALILDSEKYLHPFREGNGRTQREVIRV